MIYIDDSHIKVGGIILPGLIKNFEIKGSALIEEQNVEGRTSKPKQAVGYEDCKITIELALEDGESITKTQKLEQIQNLFKKKNQSTPQIYKIINDHTAIRGIESVIFKQMDSKEQHKTSEILVNLEFWENVPITITTIKGTSVDNYTPTKSDDLTDQYNLYLNQRGESPKLNNKSDKSPASDTASTDSFKNKLKQLPYKEAINEILFSR